MLHPNTKNPELKLKNEEKKDLITEDDLYPCVTRLSDREIKLTRPNIEERIFEFDQVISSNSSQENTFNIIGKKIVDDVLEGYNGTIMAYGQTGSGKTYTIFGGKRSFEYNEEIIVEMGLVPRVVRQLFDHVRQVNENKIIAYYTKYLKINI